MKRIIIINLALWLLASCNQMQDIGDVALSPDWRFSRETIWPGHNPGSMTAAGRPSLVRIPGKIRDLKVWTVMDGTARL
jgi:hypothetical protein